MNGGTVLQMYLFCTPDEKERSQGRRRDVLKLEMFREDVLTPTFIISYCGKSHVVDTLDLESVSMAFSLVFGFCATRTFLALDATHTDTHDKKKKTSIIIIFRTTALSEIAL